MALEGEKGKIVLDVKYVYIDGKNENCEK